MYVHIRHLSIFISFWKSPVEFDGRIKTRTSKCHGSARLELIHLYLFMRFSIFHVTRMSEIVTFGREIVAYARHLAEY